MRNYLFIDETSTLVGAGLAEGLWTLPTFKGGLAGESFETIGANTLYEYPQHIEKDLP
jgi:ATP-dependent Clp protease ATP-binding subunit ClpA